MKQRRTIMANSITPTFRRKKTKQKHWQQVTEVQKGAVIKSETNLIVVQLKWEANILIIQACCLSHIIRKFQHYISKLGKTGTYILNSD